MAEFIRRSKEAVAYARAFLLVADLLIHVRQKVLGGRIDGLGKDQFVLNLYRSEVLTLVVKSYD